MRRQVSLRIRCPPFSLEGLSRQYRDTPLGLKFYRRTKPAYSDTLFVVGAMNKRSSVKSRRVTDPWVAEWFEARNITVQGYAKAQITYSNVMSRWYRYSRSQEMAENKAAWQESYYFMKREFGAYVLGSRVVSWQEVVDNIDPMTSPGAPWNVTYHDKSFIEEDWFKVYLMKFWSDLEDGEPLALWNIFGKEEVLPTSKVETDGCRALTGAPVEHVICQGRLCQDFNEKMYASATAHASCVGFSEFHGGRNQIVRRMEKHLDGWESDISGQDASTKIQFFQGTLQLRLESLRKEDRTVGNCIRMLKLINLMIFALAVDPQGEIWQSNGGNKSGQSNTVVDNTMNAFRVLAYAFVRLRPDDTYTYADFHESVAAFMYGDDAIWSVARKYQWFSGYKVAYVAYTELHILLKIPENLPKSPRDLSFLSASTVSVDGVYVPYRPHEKFKASLLLMSTKPPSLAATFERLMGLRVAHWACPESNRLANLMFRDLRNELIVDRMDPLVAVVMRSWHSNQEMLQLYTGIE